MRKEEKGQPLDDPSRLEEIKKLGFPSIRDDSSLDRYTRLAAKMLNIPISLVTIVDPTEQHFLSSTGLPGEVSKAGKTPVSYSFCQHVVKSGKALVVTDAREHPLVCDNPIVQEFGVVSYMGVPVITPAGNVLGSFCVLDTAPRHWEDDDIAFMEDLCAAIVNEIDLRRSKKMLEISVQDLRKSEKRREELIHMIVHDLRNPLNGIVGGMDLLKSSASFDANENELFDLCRESCDSLMEMIEDILETGKLAHGQDGMDFAEIDISNLVQDVSNQAKLIASRSKSNFHCTQRADLKTCRCDRGILQRALQNLLGNAFKYCPGGSKVELLVKSGKNPESLDFIVKDDGPGIRKENLDQIFGKYETGNRDKGEKHSFGLGLTFCKMAAEAHQGDLTVTSEVGVGSEFCMTIPCK